MNEHVTWSSAGGVFRITLDRPDRRNAVGTLMAEGLLEACKEAATDPALHCLILNATGTVFCAGADLGVSKEKPAEEWLLKTTSILRQLLLLPCPVITAIQGPALGLGGGLALTGDFVLASEGASLGFPEVHHGLVPGVISVILRERASPALLRRLLYLGKTMTPTVAAEIGLVDQVVPAARLEAEVEALAESLRDSSPTALRLTKRLLRENASLSFEKALRCGATMTLIGRATEDAKEGLAAFKERRRPEWTGR